MRSIISRAALCLFLPTLPSLADVTVPPIFSDHVVLQQGMNIPVWGRAEPGEKVTATLAGQTVTTVAKPDGRWQATFRKLPAGGPHTLVLTGSNTIQIEDVLIGEVWFCGGQSNMEFPVESATNAPAEIASADFPQIRMFTAKKVVAGEPQEKVEGSWQVCTPETVKKFSAVGYFFGRELHQRLKAPVGLVHSSAGWTPAEAWMSRQALESDPDFAVILKRWDEVVAAGREYEAKLAAWKSKAEKTKAEGRETPPQPDKPKADPNFIHRASGLWNGSVAPLARFPIRGVIWYQGETNDGRGHQYRKLFPALIKDWRRAWGQPKLPFLFVQLAAVLPPDSEPKESEWSEVREAQAMALALPNTGMAVAIDIGEEKDVHPKNKQDVGHRLALIARAKVYGEQNLVYSGPIYRSMNAEPSTGSGQGGNQIRLSFDHVEGGLMTPGETALHHFAIAGTDKKFVWAEARIDGKDVVVWSDQVPEPVAVRYAWANNPVGCNLFNKAGLPASPFRTDDWPGKSFGVTKMWIDQ